MTTAADVWRDMKEQYADLEAWIGTCPVELKSLSVTTADGRVYGYANFAADYQRMASTK